MQGMSLPFSPTMSRILPHVLILFLLSYALYGLIVALSGASGMVSWIRDGTST